jgi:ribosomal protein L7Ae-like RNA K-turn-binding protein
MLGFAMRAGKLCIGTPLVCKGLGSKDFGGIRLVLVSAEASEGTKKKLRCKCEFYGMGMWEIPIETEALGKLLGKTYAPAVIGVCDDGFAREIDAAMASRNNDTERKFPPRGNR